MMRSGNKMVAPLQRVPKIVTDKRKKIAKTFGVTVSRAFLIHDQLVGKILKEYKRKGKRKIEIEI